MTEQPPPPSASRKGERRFWITLGEIVALLALVIAGLNYWDAHREHAAVLDQASARQAAEAALVMTGVAGAGGDRITLQPLNSGQAIQSQRYMFPHAVLDHPMEVTAAQPQIDRGWIEGGLKRTLADAHAGPQGEARLPVGVITTYVEGGDTRIDRSIYQVGFSYRAHFLTGIRISRQGVSLARRAVRGDLQSQVEARWQADQAAFRALDQVNSSP